MGGTPPTLLGPGQAAAAVAAGWAFSIALIFSALVLVTPLATIALGVILRHDPFGPRLVIGPALTLAGVLIIVLRADQLAAVLMTRNGTE